MNNPYTGSFETIRALYVDYHRRKTAERFESWKCVLTREQIQKQLDSGSGEIINEIKTASEDAARKTENVEFIVALQLADFYFPNQEKELSFELRRDVNPASIKTFEDLTGSFEDHTYIDCLVRSGGKSICYQVKRYRGNSTPEAFIDWLIRVLKHYGNMSGISLVILPEPLNNVAQPLALDKLYEIFIRDAAPNVTFDKISLLYNDARDGCMVLHELYPRQQRTLIDLNLALARIRGDA